MSIWYMTLTEIQPVAMSKCFEEGLLKVLVLIRRSKLKIGKI